MEKFGPPPFGTLLSANANPSTLENWGEDSWVTLQQIGNMREHNNYWYLTEIFNQAHPQPALNGEPYYSGYMDARGQGGGRGYQFGAPGGTEKDDQFVRSAMYGNFLSGGLAGHVYGAEGIWGADIEPAAPTKMWDAFQWNSGSQMQHLRTFAFSIGKRYQELVPLADLVSPNKTHDIRCYEGWAYCARTPDKKIFLAYFEKGCPRSQMRGARLKQHLSRGVVRPAKRHVAGRTRRRNPPLQRDRHHHAARFPRRHRLGPAPHLSRPHPPVERLAERTLGGLRGGPPDVWRDGRRCATGHRPRSGRPANELDLTNAG